MRLTLFTMPICHACHDMGEYLERNQLSFHRIDVTTDAMARSFLRVRNGGRLTVPALHDADTSRLIIGYSPERIEDFLGT